MDENTKPIPSEEGNGSCENKEENAENAEAAAASEGEEKPTESKNRSKAANIIQISLICLFGGIFLASVIYLIIGYMGKLEGAKMYEEIAEEYSVFDPTSEASTTSALPPADKPMQTLEGRLEFGKDEEAETEAHAADNRLTAIRSSIVELKKKNPDVYGWIFVSDSDINYPIVKGTDNQFYLDHGIDKNYLAIGTIFADAGCKNKITDNFNTVFYGHNVVTDRKGSSMFHDVTKFLNKDYFNNTVIYVYTMDGIYMYKPFSIYGTTSDHFYFTTEFSSEDEFLKFASRVKALSDFQTAAIIGKGDTIITLSTCTNGPKNQRYALHAVLVDSITDQKEPPNDTE